MNHFSYSFSGSSCLPTLLFIPSFYSSPLFPSTPSPLFFHPPASASFLPVPTSLHSSIYVLLSFPLFSAILTSQVLFSTISPLFLPHALSLALHVLPYGSIILLRISHILSFNLFHHLSHPDLSLPLPTHIVLHLSPSLHHIV